MSDVVFSAVPVGSAFSVISQVWSHEASWCYQVFGCLGAMSASYACLPPPRGALARQVPTEYAVAAIAAFVCIARLPQDPQRINTWLYGLHACLLGPKLLRLPGSVNACALYCVLAACALAVQPTTATGARL